MHHASEIIVLGGSAGSYNLIIEIIDRLPESFSAALIIVIHRNAKYVTKIEEILSARLHKNIKQAQDKAIIMPNTIYFALPGYHLLIEPDFSFSLDTSEAIQFSKPSIDVLFESAIDTYKERCTAFLLSGANKDGANGINLVQQYGGTAFVQDPMEAKISTMPHSALARNAQLIVLSNKDIISYFEKLK